MVEEATCQANNLMAPFNEWANKAEEDPHPDLQTALRMLRLLIEYARQFCDAGPTLGQVASIADARLGEVRKKAGDAISQTNGT